MTSLYDKLLQEMQTLQDTPQTSTAHALERQHSKGRLSVWERLSYLTDGQYDLYWRNFGDHEDGASIVTAIGDIHGREVAIYGHDFMQRAGSMDANNGRKLADFLAMAGKLGIPVVGLNDSAGAFIPAGVGGLESYAKAFKGLRDISGRVPSIMTMFGFNAGGGAYLPRQGSFMIQPQNTFYGLTGPDVVRRVLGEQITADELGGPATHQATGVTDFAVETEYDALNLVIQLLQYIPSSSDVAPARVSTSDPQNRECSSIEHLLRHTLNSPSGFYTPFDIRILIQGFVDHGAIFEFQPQRAQNMVCAFSRLDGLVTGVVANNSAFLSGQIDCDAANKATRFIRFCNLYNIPLLFLEDTTGFLPGSEQEKRGIVRAGRAMLDAIVDLRVPRMLCVVRNAFGGAYASFNNYSTGADVVFALPTARIAVMGTAGAAFVYKQEIKAIENAFEESQDTVARSQALDELYARYTHEFLNAHEAVRLGAVSDMLDPLAMRSTFIRHLNRLWQGYSPGPMTSLQREFF